MEMSESQFIQEVRHRASLLTGSFNPDRAIRWGRQGGNLQWINQLQAGTRQYLSGNCTPQ
ncbi:hypothetical protein ACV2HJ_16805 [Salmonella enterica subsp. enterica serovar Miami]|uniref:hypothetical protein n=1 Tax=Salmonella enterica TaxID=28901 RepID=UPI0003EB62E8|nr:hypothetical protein [Salmonella enterica subsp. enterica serovar Newport]EAN8326089.1 hypothetical protein [Salmonella enterica]EBR9315100.1 hypothetical protein [Salmonella enterica subsp. enterica serovar Muenchen]EBV1877876.1 hypothetical protein [Salmonella enterica subsp. enterica serovar Adelaide]EBV3722105.1 hypothetical protein [Salmonella enterica subsp. enterica serovar Oranienburg]EBV8523413.1 hypothetical protein [Salmonella enterica subsp. enterica serovar Larochelle]ECE04403